MADPFVHLHVHTEYSILDGAARIKELMAEANRLAMPAVAITDHGNMYGAYDFYHQAIAAGVTPIIGVEAYVAPESRYDKRRIRWGSAEQKKDDVSGSGGYTHMTILARNHTGLKNLMKLSSRASIEGQLGKWPRMDFGLIAEHSEGIMGTTGCPSGVVQTRLRLGQFDDALKSAAIYQEALGKDNYFLEIMDHGIEIERRVRDGLLEIGRKLDIKPLVTNDSHYTYERQAQAHDVLLCVQTASTVDDPNRFRFDGNGYFVKSAEQMRAIDSSDAWQAGCRNTLLVAERVESYAPVFAEINRMPLFDVPEGETQESWLEKETWEGLSRRFPHGVPGEYRERVKYELEVIMQMGFPSYFLVVADLLRFARESRIRYAPGRGSATGCLVAYALEIIELDPIHHGLIFERFLNPERVSMPDIDLDFDESRRGEIINYVTQKYGTDKVCQIVTFGTIKSKAALKDAARVLGFPYAVGDQLTKAMPPPVAAKDIPLSGIIDPSHPRYTEAAEFRALLESNPEAKQVFDTALGLEGLIRQAGVHAAGVILSCEPLQDVIPVIRREDGTIISGWDYPACESLGLLKMDFLGLRNLKIIDDAIANIRNNHDPNFDWSAHRLEDRKTYELLATGETLGVFQLDGGPMRALLKAMAPTNYVDIAAVLALYRPGPMAANAHIDYADRKNGRKPVVPIHEEFRETLAEILDPTYGLIVFQEQVLAIARTVAGYSLGRADLLRRAMGKKKKEVLDKEFAGFQAGMKENGYSDEAINRLWEILLPFSGYAFNKSHTAGYGVLSFWTAHMKANYPAEYMAALLTSVGDSPPKMAVYLTECRRMGISVLPPDVNESAGPFTPIDGKVRFGLEAVRNVGSNVVESIIATRSAKGKFVSFNDFMDKIDLAPCNKRVMESLIKAGAFDSLGETRRGLFEHHESAVDVAVDTKRNEAFGQFDLFSDTPISGGGGAGSIVGLPTVYSRDEWDRKTKLAFEREMLGLYVSDHPLAGAERILKKEADTMIAEISEEVPDRTNVVIAGLISSIERRVNKEGKSWAIVKIEDLTGAIEVLFFPKSYEIFGQELLTDRIVAVQGRVNHRENATSIFGSDLKVLEFADADRAAENPPLVIALDAHRILHQLIAELKRILDSHRGKSPVHIKLRNGQRTTLLNLANYSVEPSVSLWSELKELLGAGCLE